MAEPATAEVPSPRPVYRLDPATGGPVRVRMREVSPGDLVRLDAPDGETWRVSSEPFLTAPGTGEPVADGSPGATWTVEAEGPLEGDAPEGA